MLDKQNKPTELIDLLATTPSLVPFANRVQDLILSPNLERKVLQQEGRLPAANHSIPREFVPLTADDEKELATEMLILRHRFTEIVLNSRKFRQATLTIVQNIYLFQNRKIFFGTTSSITSEEERQEALYLFSSNPSKTSIPLAKTFQHLILARVWNRILSNSTQADHEDQSFIDLHDIVEKLNTIRNIYMLLTTGLIKKLITRINDIYKESITVEDAIQIGSFGIARAAYRYHQSSGVRFSTFAANWVFKEIQRQSLKGRLIRLSAHTVEQYTRAAKADDTENLCKYTTRLQNATITGKDTFTCQEQVQSSLVRDIESKELKATLLNAIDQTLSGKSSDVIRRRFGLPPYHGQEQSVITISRVYGVTRGSIYQLEQSALKKLSVHLKSVLV